MGELYRCTKCRIGSSCHGLSLSSRESSVGVRRCWLFVPCVLDAGNSPKWFRRSPTFYSQKTIKAPERHASPTILVDAKMSSLTTELLIRNPNYIYPLAVNLVASIVPVWASLQVSAARKRIGLKYPAEYFYTPCDENTEKDKFIFNCTQRAHQVPAPYFPGADGRI